MHGIRVVDTIMNTAAQIPPPLPRHQSIRYQLSRGDVFANWMTVIFRNRILQVFVLVMLVVNGWLILAPSFGKHAIGQVAFEAVLYVVGFVGFLVVVQG
jgi:hypothetical protein